MPIVIPDMSVLKIVNEYYRAWQERRGDMSQVPLADDFRFTGPVASFTDAAGFRAMAARAGAAVRDFRVRRQFAEGDSVCSIVDWQMDPLPATLTAAEILRVANGQIVSGELIYDAEDLRKAMAPEPQTVVNAVDINAGPRDVWAVLGDLAATRDWLPGVVSARVEGDLRVCVMADGQEVHEEISQYDSQRHGFSFRHVRTGLPVRALRGTFAVRGKGNGTSVVTLATTFEPVDVDSAGEVSGMIEQAFGQSLESLRRLIEEKRRWDG